MGNDNNDDSDKIDDDGKIVVVTIAIITMNRKTQSTMKYKF